MPKFLGVCLPAIFALCLFSGLKAQEIEMTPNVKEMVLEEGNILQIKCTGDSPIVMAYPVSKEDSVVTSPVQVKKSAQEGKYTVSLARLRTVAGDTGWYGCTFDTNALDDNETMSNQSARIYVYVKSAQILFAQLPNVVETSTGDNAIIPCRPTWPNATMNLTRNDIETQQLLSLSAENISYDPKVGFTIFDVTVNDTAYFLCSLMFNGKEYSVSYFLIVLQKPIIRLTPLASFYEPKQLAKFNCVSRGYPEPLITWKFLRCPNYPSFNDSLEIELTNYTSEPITWIKTRPNVGSLLTFPIEVSGVMTCTSCNTEGCISTSSPLLVSDGKGAFGIIESEKEIIEGDNLQIICAVSVYNYTNDVQWANKDNNFLQETGRLQVAYEATPFTYRSILNITNISKLDSGIYICSSTMLHNSTIKKEEYYLEVQDPVKPTLLTNMNGSVISINIGTDGHTAMVFRCISEGRPTPNISWYKDDKLITTNDQYVLSKKNQELQINYWLEYNAGTYKCRAENRFGRREASQQISITGNEWTLELIIPNVLLVIAVIVLFIFVTIRIRREKKLKRELREAGLMNFEEGALLSLNPDLCVDDQANLLPYDKKYEFPRDRLKLGKQLGAGAFGVVLKANALGITEKEAVTIVAVKMVQSTTDPMYIKALASELKILIHLGKHLNVVNLLGACTKNIIKRELLVIVEYCPYGNLHNYLLKHRKTFINQIDPETGKLNTDIGRETLEKYNKIMRENPDAILKDSANSKSGNTATYVCVQSCNSDTVLLKKNEPYAPASLLSQLDLKKQPGWRSNYSGDYNLKNLKPICSQDLLSWSFQVARGMDYLSARKVLHGDLAARNILLAEDGVVKICDFGLAKNMYKDDNYKKTGDAPLPIKWMAIESIRDQIFSTQSDVWSFGIVLWEFFTLAKTPYPGMEPIKQYQKLLQGYRMEQPEFATKETYNVMLECWKTKPEARPSFPKLVDDIGDLLEKSVKTYYITLNEPYMDMNRAKFESGQNDYLLMMSAPDHSALTSMKEDSRHSTLERNTSNLKDAAEIPMLRNSMDDLKPNAIDIQENADKLQKVQSKTNPPLFKRQDTLSLKNESPKLNSSSNLLMDSTSSNMKIDLPVMNHYDDSPRKNHKVLVNNADQLENGIGLESSDLENEMEHTNRPNYANFETPVDLPAQTIKTTYVNIPNQTINNVRAPVTINNSSYLGRSDNIVQQTKL
ncbi:platelet-derived growth factor receptor alpha-like [Prorops nasuta]|uniref:platelet-derived growth factor receptor alpha-like n=1 Tax=Prorops nasuta TaxID=863751 RepID=UPI0034CF18D7